MKRTIFWDMSPCNPVELTFRKNISLPYSGSKSKPSKKLKKAANRSLAYSSTLMMEVIYSSEMAVDTLGYTA
jgi:hypothetical protein